MNGIVKNQLLAHNTSMDDLFVSWRHTAAAVHLSNTIWHRYLPILKSLGPFGDECRLTVHASMGGYLISFFSLLTSSRIRQVSFVESGV
jgi:hypothetical protein